jgi:hypothetical protein
MIIFAFNAKGVFVAGTVLSSVHYVSTCCEFSQVSFTSAFLAIVLFLVSTAMLVLFVILLARSLKDRVTEAKRSPLPCWRLVPAAPAQLTMHLIAAMGTVSTQP